MIHGYPGDLKRVNRFVAWCRNQEPAAVESFRRTDGSDRYFSPVLAGKDGSGQFRIGHDHAHYLPTAEGADDRRVTHVTVYAREGFGSGETAALSSLRRLKVGERELQVQLVGLGQPADFRAKLFGDPATSKVWVSATPFVGPAHIGRVGRQRYLRKALRSEVRRWLEKQPGQPSVPFEVEALEKANPAWKQHPRPFEFRRGRERKGDDGYQRAFGIYRVTFAVPMPGPLCVGYSSHFGLGLFLPEPDAG